jgi:hypothetical protein
MMENKVQRMAAKTSRVVSVEVPDSREGVAAPGEAMAGCEIGVEEDGVSGSVLRLAQSPMDALRMGMALPFRNLLKPAPLPGLLGLEESPRGSNGSATEVENSELLKVTLSGGVERDAGAERSRLQETRRDGGQGLVMVAFDANVKEVSHGGIVWAIEHVLKRGDTLAVVSVLDSVRGPLGYRVRIGDQKWLSGNQKLVEEEIQQKLEVWRSFPGLENRCEEGGVKLVVTVKAAQRGELAICKEAVTLGACHVVLDKSLKNRRREFYLQNLSCDVTRMRRSGGVDVIRPSLDMAMMLGLVQRHMPSPHNALDPPRSPTSVIPPPLLSYGDQIDVFEISLGPKFKRVAPKPSPAAPPPLPSPKPSRDRPEWKSGELRRLTNSAVLASAHERSSSMSLSLHARSSSGSVPSAQLSLTSSSNATEHDADDDLFSIFHGSTRHTEIDTEIFNRPSTSGYESDDLFSIGNASPRRIPTLEYHHSGPLAPGHYPIPNPSLDSCEHAISEPLREATISRITFVVGLGEAVAVSLRHPLLPGEGLLVGSSPSALFLMHSDHHHASAATPGSYIAMEGSMAMKLAFLEPEQRVLVVDALGRCRTVPVRQASTAATPLVLVEAQCEGRRHSATLHHTESVRLCRSQRPGETATMASVKSLKVGDRVLLRLRSSEPSHAIWSS